MKWVADTLAVPATIHTFIEETTSLPALELPEITGTMAEFARFWLAPNQLMSEAVGAELTMTPLVTPSAPVATVEVTVRLMMAPWDAAGMRSTLASASPKKT